MVELVWTSGFDAKYYQHIIGIKQYWLNVSDALVIRIF